MRSIILVVGISLIGFLMGCSDVPTTSPQNPPPQIIYSTLHGGVYDSVGGKPLDSARITTQPVTKTVYSNQSGYFEIDSMVVGTLYHVFVARVGYINFEDTITITNSYNQITATVYVENSNWTYLTSMNEYMNNHVEVLNNGNLLSTTRILNYSLNTYVQVAGTNQWNFIFTDEETIGYYKNSYNNYVFAYTGDNISPMRTPDLFLSVNSGVSWSHKLAGSVFGMAFFSSSVAYAAMYYRPSTFELKKSTDHGQNWFNVNPIPGFEYYNIKKVLNERIILQSSNSSSNDSIYFSDNEGLTWQVKILSNGNYANYIRSSIKLNNNTLITKDAYNSDFRIVKSNDNGDSWFPVSSNFPVTSRDSVNIYVASNSYIYAIKKSEERGIYVSTDNGMSYNKISIGLPRNKFPASVGFDGQGYVYIVVGNFIIGGIDTKRIYKSNVTFVH